MDGAGDSRAGTGVNAFAASASAAGHVSGLPVYFERCFGFLHLPAPRNAGGRGVVLCSPDGYEALCVHRCWGRLAGGLASAGVPTLRFDYPGCGDAQECDEDPERIRARLDGVRDAVAFLRRQTGVTEVVLVGLRFGALLASAAAQEMAAAGNPVDAVALLAPPASGEAYYKELRVLAMMARAKPAPGTTVPQSLQAAGFYYSPETLAAIRAVAPARAGTPPAPRILIMDREDGASLGLADAFRSNGSTVDIHAFPGCSALIRDAVLATYPEEDFGRVIQWVRSDAPPAVAVADAPAPKGVIAVPGGRERPVSIGSDGLFGILSEPEVPTPGGPALVILNTGANHRVGTNRLGVLLARRLLRDGVTVLRVDLRGIGDSPSAPDWPDNAVLEARMVSDVRAAVAFLAELGHREIVVNGLCAGGWLAYHAALAEPRITGQLLLNVQNLWLNEGFDRIGASNREYLRKVRAKETWLRLFKGDVKLHVVFSVLSKRVAKALAIRVQQIFRRARGAETLADATRRELSGIGARGTRTALIFTREDAGLDEMEMHFGREGRELQDVAGVSIIIIEDGDHLFSVKSSRDHMLELMAAQFSNGRFSPTATRVVSAPRAATLKSQTA